MLMSGLQDLLVALDGVTKEAEQHAAQLAQQARRLGQAAAGAARAAQGSGHVDSNQTAIALQSAQRSISQAAQHLHQAALAGKGFVARYAGGGAGGVVPSMTQSGGGSTGTSYSRSTGSSLAAFWSSHRGEYVQPSEEDWSPVPSNLPAHSDPHRFASWVNDGGNEKPGRGVNCADCARSVEASWRGEPQVSAARASGRGGESFGRIEEWLGTPLTSSNFSDIGISLANAGHGSSAYVVVTWKGGGGHAFNAVNYQGTAYFIDAQPTGGAVDTWPPKRTSPGYGFDEADVNKTFVNYRGA